MDYSEIAARTKSKVLPILGIALLLLVPTRLFSESSTKSPIDSEAPTVIQPGDTPSTPSGTTALQKQLVKVVLATSRPEITRNHAWGLTADITNVSSHPLSIYTNEVQLIMQPEATNNTQCVAAFQSFIPNTQKSKGSGTVIHLGSDEQVFLQPAEHYMFFWSGNDPGSVPGTAGYCELGWWGRMKETLNFIPGTYSFSVEGKLHLVEASNSYHTFAESVSVKLSIEQFAILFFAGLGAILGYLVVALRTDGDIDQMKNADNRQSRLSAVLVFLRKLISAFLTGAILSIVASRLSDTQFPVKVSVNDVWGAVTVGFIFFFIGDKLIEKIKGFAK